ncbi:hypothetical protein BWQ96_05490 [Gracilariopsis chorda]|uniref:BTB domain-containing protein n=1 Tax=Gracilariopsis chorda TaxID=448386 RepID=A0A2V3IRH5_9FLOR|nr:hypothetical protein BWQ96_05490 [Gracilariopsis chorda]|eukprot:PXF44731.1 hypothetical protein BWQ96_05490 [Gracilariopsis chorda]
MAPSTDNMYALTDFPEKYSYNPSDDQFRSHLLSTLLHSPTTAHKICDVVLITSDHHKVPACRALLAVHSEYFRTLFFSEFKQSEPDAIQLTMRSSVLHHVLTFAYTGHCALVRDMLDSPHFSHFFRKHDELRLLVELAAAADYYGFVLLHRWCDSALHRICTRFHAAACTVVQAMSDNDASHPSRALLVKLIRSNCKTAFNVPQSVSDDSTFMSNAFMSFGQTPSTPQPVFVPRTDVFGAPLQSRRSEKNVITPFSSMPQTNPVQQVLSDPNTYGILELSPQVLDEVLSDSLASNTHEYLVQCIFYWVTRGSILRRKNCKLKPVKSSSTKREAACKSENTVNKKESKHSTCDSQQLILVDDDRFEWGKKFVSRLDLKAMRIRFVHDFVIPTGLVENVDLLDMLWNYVLSTTCAIAEL